MSYSLKLQDGNKTIKLEIIDLECNLSANNRFRNSHINITRI